MTIRPSPTSRKLIFFLPTRGASKAVQSEVVAMPAKQTEALEARADAKKANQCTPIEQPINNILSRSRLEVLTIFPVKTRTTPNPKAARRVL